MGRTILVDPKRRSKTFDPALAIGWGSAIQLLQTVYNPQSAGLDNFLMDSPLGVDAHFQF